MKQQLLRSGGAEGLRVRFYLYITVAQVERKNNENEVENIEYVSTLHMRLCRSVGLLHSTWQPMLRIDIR